MLALAPALISDYLLLLADELSFGLAPILVEEVFEVLSEIRASGVSIVIVDQFAERILSQADWCYVLRKGAVVFDGPASELEHRVDYLQSLWDRIAATPQAIPVSDWHRAIIDERLKDLEVNPDAGDSWEVVQERLRKKFSPSH